MIAIDNMLGVGIYTPAEAAFYARVPLQTLNRWFFGNQQGEPVTAPRFANEPERTITFLDFVQALAIRNARIEYGVSLNKIREGIERAEGDYKIKYPLARQRVIYLFGKDLYILRSEDDLAKATGTDRAQKMIMKVVELYMKDIGFDESGLANLYTAFTWKDITIRMDPKLRLGEPLLSSCGYSAQALWEACKAEGSSERAAKLYGVRPEDIEAAYRYHDHLQVAHVT